MTEEQMSMMKKLIKKHGIGATDGEWSLVYLGVRYGLLEQQVCINRLRKKNRIKTNCFPIVYYS